MSSHWTFGKRIAATCAAVLLITLLLGAYAVWQLKRVEAKAGIITADCLPGVYIAGKVDSRLAEAERGLREHILTTDPKLLAEIEAGMDAGRTEITGLLKSYEATIRLKEDRELFAKIQAARGPYMESRTAVLELSRAGKKTEALELLKTRHMGIYATYERLTEELGDFNKRNADTESESIVSTVRNAVLGSTIGVGIALLIGAAAAFYVIRSLNKLLRRTISTISDSASQVSSAAGQVSGASQSLAEGASEQAASVEETSASLEEMSSMTKNNTDHAERANDLARRTRQSADAGAVEMEEMRRAMDAMKGSSDAIAKIVNTIEEIAFQTNILALNAAVEAARAGEAGMGFAVVADEVRNLAQRAAQAAQETSSKIEDAIQKSEHGVNISSSVAKALSEIVENVRQMDGIVSEIATASREQTQGITQVNSALSQMDKVTQANAGNAEENAAAAEELNAQAAAMQEAIEELRQLVEGSRRSVAGLSTGSYAAVSAAQSAPRNRVQANPSPRTSRRTPSDLKIEDFNTGFGGSNGHGQSGTNGHAGSHGSHGSNGTNGSNGNGRGGDIEFFTDLDGGNGRR